MCLLVYTTAWTLYIRVDKIPCTISFSHGFFYYHFYCFSYSSYFCCCFHSICFLFFSFDSIFHAISNSIVVLQSYAMHFLSRFILWLYVFAIFPDLSYIKHIYTYENCCCHCCHFIWYVSGLLSAFFCSV